MSEIALRYVTRADACGLMGTLASEYVVVPNGPEVFPPFEVVPLGPRYPRVQTRLRALLFDMDGTTTMTEDLCLYALDTFVRKALGAQGKSFPGMDPETDFQHIIGHSSSKNVEHLVRTYGHCFDKQAFAAAYVEAVAWTLACSNNPDRRAEAVDNLEAMGGSALPKLPALHALVAAFAEGRALPAEPRGEAIATMFHALEWDVFGVQVRAGLEIYYHALQDLFERIAAGRGEEVALALYGPAVRRPVSPLPGVGMAMAMAQGLLADDAEACFDYLLEGSGNRVSIPDVATAKRQFISAARHLGDDPAAVALVTSSGRYEVDVVIPVVFEGLREEIQAWPVSEETRTRLLAAFSDFESFYAAIVTASDSHEIRLKPYRDLYTIALQQLGITAGEACDVAGFEDTEPGVVAQRGAGVGVACAVPFEGTKRHNFQAASHVLEGGIAEAMLVHALFLPDLRTD